ncbi:MAG: hypothetical protein KC466_08030 [Myxococcales bacterium]|nr:hypothetical protein [Myxococcales bacterium]
MNHLGRMEFEAEGDAVRIRTPNGETLAPRHWFLRGIHRLRVFDLRLNDIRLYGGLHFLMDDAGERVRVGLRPCEGQPKAYYEDFSHAEVLAWLARAHEDLAPEGFTHFI